MFFKHISDLEILKNSLNIYGQISFMSTKSGSSHQEISGNISRAA